MRRVEADARHEHVVRPHQEADHRDAHARPGDRVVPEDVLPAEAGMTSLITPMPGRIMMYTAGWE